MVTGSVPLDDAGAAAERRASWMPLIVIAVAQILMVFNVSTLQVSIEAISSSFDVPATSIGTAIVTYALVVAGLILLGARVVEIYGSRLVFKIGVALFGAAMAIMAASQGMATAVVAQVVAGAAAALLVPTLVVLIAENYRGPEQAKALAWLGGSAAMGVVLAFLIAAVLAAWIGWRFTFSLLVLLAAALYKLSERFARPTPRPGVGIDVFAAVLVVRLFDRMSPRATARYAFLAVAVGVALLGTVIRNDWSDAAVILGMVIIGLGEGALVSLLFNVLVTASPKELAGDVGSLRGTINNLATGVGTALASTLVVALLGATVHRELVHDELIPPALKTEINLDQVPFVSNGQLRSRLAQTAATAEQVARAERINTDARLLALKVTFYGLAGLALLAYFPAGALPGRVRIVAAEGEARSARGENPVGPSPAGGVAA